MKTAEECRNGHLVPSIRIFCPTCHEFVVLDNSPVLSGRLRTALPITLLIVDCLGALVLMRATGSFLSAYAFVSFAVLNLYALAYSRGAALLMTVTATTAATLLWVAGTQYADDAPRQFLVLGFLAAWALAVLYAYIVGQQFAVPAVRARATYFLVLIALVMGLWCVVAVVLEDDTVSYRSVLYGAMAVLVLAPVVFAGVVATGWDGGNRAATEFATLSAYLFAVDLLIRFVLDVFRIIESRIFAVALPGSVTDPHWLTEALAWRSVASAALGGLAVVVLLAQSVVILTQEFRAAHHELFTSQIAASVARIQNPGDALARISEQIVLAALRLTRVFYLIGVFLSLLVAELTRKAAETVRDTALTFWYTARYLVIPVAALSFLAVLLMTVLRDTVLYSSGVPTSDSPLQWWSGLACVAGLGILVCSLAFALAPLSDDERMAFNGVTSVVVLGTAFWALFSVTSVILWFLSSALRSAGQDVRPLGFGPELFTNLAVVVASLLLMLGVVLVIDVSSRRQSAARAPMVVAGFCSLLLAGSLVAVFLGAHVMSRWYTFITT